MANDDARCIAKPSVGEPPADVRLLLATEHTALPAYFDAQQTEALRQVAQHWPGLWRLAGGTA